MKKEVSRIVSMILCLALLCGVVAPAGALRTRDEEVLELSDYMETVELPAAAEPLAADDYEIYPTPRSVTYDAGGATVTLPATLRVVYGTGVDDYTKARATAAFAQGGITLSASATGTMRLRVGIKGKSDEVNTYFASHTPTTSGLFDKHDAYQLIINADGVAVLGKDTDAAFYGLTTVKHILAQVGSSRVVKQLKLEDYADIPIRGTIEGYYGSPWSWEDREEIMRFGGEFKSNIYVYAPKDDPKHNSKWRELYTEEELVSIRSAAAAGNESKCYFGYALHPFMSNRINFSTDETYAADLNIIKAKFTQVMDAGVRQLVLLADDASGATTDNIKRLMGDLTEWVSSSELQTRYPGLRTTIPFCPSNYMYTDSAELRGLADMTPKAPLIMTGGQIWGTVANTFIQNFCNAIYPTTVSGSVTAEVAAANAKKGPFFWINWPCNDNSKNHITMGGQYRYLEPGITEANLSRVQGLVINCMQLSEPSKVAEFLVSQYGWNVWETQAESETARLDSYDYVDHGTAASTPASEALRLLSNNTINLDRGADKPVLDESAELQPKLAAFQEKMEAGTLTQSDITAMKAEFQALKDAADLYKAQGGNPRLVAQMEHFLPAWSELAEADVTLLEALGLIISNENGANDNAIVAKYLAGQSKLQQSRSHYFYHKAGDAATYVAAEVGVQYIKPFTNNLMALVAETAQTIIDPSIVIETPITSFSTSGMAGTIDYMVDNDVSTVAIFKSNSSGTAAVAVGDYVGVTYNRVIPIHSVRIELGQPSNTNDTFNGSKLQYRDASNVWKDIPNATFTHSDLVIERNDLNLNASGIRLIATEARGNTWVGVKEFFVNDDVQQEASGGGTTLTLIRTSGWTVYDGAEANLFDGDDSTCVWYNDAQNSPVGDFIGADLGKVTHVGAVRFVVGNGTSGDKWSSYKLQYSTDNTNWTDYNNGQVFTTSVVEVDLNGVSARYVRLVNQTATNKWLKFSEISITDNDLVVNDYEKVAYQSDTARVSKPTGTLADDAASVAAQGVVLRPNEYVGIALPRIREIITVVADYTAAAGLVVEAGMSESEMNAIDPADYAPGASAAAEPLYARYVRIRNTGTNSVSFRLNALSVTSAEVERIHYEAAMSHMGKDSTYGSQDNRERALFFDGDLTTVGTLAQSQTAGDYVTYDLGQVRPIKKLIVAMADGTQNYLRKGKFQVSLDGTAWTDVITVNNEGAFSSTILDVAEDEASAQSGVPQMNYVSFVGELAQAVDARYLRILVSESASTRFISANEIIINSRDEYLPTVNDPTFYADPIEVNASCTPALMRDGNLTTGFTPNMTGRTSGSVTYRLSDNTNIGRVNVVQDGSVASNAEVEIRVGADQWVSLGRLTEALTQLDVPKDYPNVYEIRVSWGNVTPTIYEIIPVDRSFTDASASGGQTSSGVETVAINAYGGEDCTIRFDENWKFNLGDVTGANALVFNDASWRTVDLPHDFSIEQDYTSAGEAESGYLPGGTGWYRKSFTVSSAWEGKTVTLQFGGAYMDTEVYLNGTKLGEHHYGYTPFSFKLTGLNYSGENVLAVKVVSNLPSSRWYSGAGLYRSVFLSVADAVHVPQYGTYITTTNAGAVTVKTTVQNDGASAASATVKQEIFKLDGSYQPAGTAVATNTSSATSVAANGSQQITQNLTVSSPDLWNSWDKGTPNLYLLKTSVMVDGETVDTYETEFGFREIQFSVNEGFILNGRHVKLKGVCMHHDQGGLGAEAWYRAIERQMEILKEMGCNAVRVTHNPAADELIEICQRIGLMVIDEAFDGWVLPKNGNSNDFARWFNTSIGADNHVLNGAGKTWAQLAVETMVHRDKNSPAVIMYSLGNEVQEGTDGINQSFVTACNNLISWIQAIDRTRFLTRGDNSRSGAGSGYQSQINQAIADAGGAVGFNYYGGSQNPTLGGHNAGWPMYGGETASATNSRGVYDRKNSNTNGGKSDKVLTSYDKSAVGWGATASDAWWRTIQYDYNAGEFVWTGFDYIGEPTPWNGTGGGWVSGEDSPKSSFFGIVDTNGIPKDSYYLYRAMWNEEDTTLHVLPTWDEADLVLSGNNRTVEVVVYSNAPVIRVYLNGTEVGAAKAVTNNSDTRLYTYKTYIAQALSGAGTNTFASATGHQSLYATFNIPYTAGRLEVKAFQADGTTQITNTVGRNVVRTTTGASKLVLSADRATIANDGRDLSYVTIDVTDASGEIVNGAKNAITVQVSGDGKLLALDNGVQPDHTPYGSATRNAGAGRLVAIVQSTKKAGSFTVSATADGLTTGAVTVSTRGAVSGADANTAVSYDLAKNYYVQVNTLPELPATATVNMGDGSTQQKVVTWEDVDETQLAAVGNEFAIAGVIDQGGMNIAVSVSVTVLDKVAALLNYSAAVQVGETPILPEARPAVMADGTVLNAQFPVDWFDATANYNKPGLVVIHGEADVFGEYVDVTATIRVSEGEIVEGTNVASQAARMYLNGTEKTSELANLRDGNVSTNWTGSGNVDLEYDTAQNIYKVKITYASAAAASAASLSWGINSTDFTPITAKTTVNGNSVTYELGTTVPAVFLRVNFAASVTVAEVELITGTPTFPISATAALDDLKVSGISATDAQLAAKRVEVGSILAEVSPVSNDNVSVTILPENAAGEIIIVTESEDHSVRSKYVVVLGAAVYPEYPYSKTTPTAGSEESTLHNNVEGPVSCVVDNDPATYWHSNWNENLTNNAAKRYIQLDLEETVEMVGLTYLPRPTVANGIVISYRIEVSDDGTGWTNPTVVASGTWAHDTTLKKVIFDDSVTAQHVRLYGVETRGGADDVANKFMSCAELRVLYANGADISPAVVDVNPKEFVWDGTAHNPTSVTVSLYGETLTEGADYTLRYGENTAAGVGQVYVDGKGDYFGTAVGTFEIKAVKLTIESFEPVRVGILATETPVLPATVVAHMSAGPDQILDVVWDEFTPPAVGETSKLVYGTVAGYQQRPVAVVSIASPVSVDGVSVVTGVGTAPDLPAEVTVQFSDGSSRQYPVVWGSVDVSTAGTKTVTGTITALAGLGITATASVRVAGMEASTDNFALNSDSSANIFPFALANISSGNNNPYGTIDGNFSTPTAASTDRWSDWERNTYHTDTKAWMGVAFETSTQLFSRAQNTVLSLNTKTVNKVVVRFVDETGKAASESLSAVTYPDAYEIQYYTGPTENLTFDTRLTTQSLTSAGNGMVRSWTNSPLLVDSNWTTVSYTGGKPAVNANVNTDVEVNFTAVNTAIIRVLVTSKASHWTGIGKLEVYGLETPTANSTFNVTSIKVDNVEKLSDFSAQKELSLEISGSTVPTVTAAADSNAAVAIKNATSIPGDTVITFTSEDGSATQTYTVHFTQAARSTYNVDVTNVHEHASVEGLTSGAAAPGATVRVVPDEGHVITSMLVVKADDPAQQVPVNEGAFTMPSFDVKIYAEVTDVEYTLAYNLVGGQVATPNPTVYSVHTTETTLTNPTKRDSSFAGWTWEGQTTPVLTVTVPTDFAPDYGDVVLTANWSSRPAHAINIAPGTHAQTVRTAATEGTVITVSAQRGYTLGTVTVTKADGTGTVPVTNGQFTMPDCDVTISAVTTPITYTITYNLDGGTLASDNPASYTVESAAFTLKNPTKAGYRFAGWTGTGLSQATVSVMVPAGSTGNRSYTATWALIPVEPESHTVTLPNDGRITAEPASGLAGTEITLIPANGYELTNVTVTTAGGENVTVSENTFTMPDDNVTVTATIKAIVYTITYDLAGGQVSRVNPATYTIESRAITLNNPVKTGYAFAGWTGTGLVNASTAVIIAAGSTGNRVYVATWVEKPGGDTPDRPSTGGGTTIVVGNASDTVTNPDGTTTQRELDGRTGTLTETTVYPDGTETVLVTAADGATKRTTTDPDGRVSLVEVDAQGNTTITVVDPVGEVEALYTIPAAEDRTSGSRYLDVPDDHWAEAAIDRVSELGLFKGTAPQIFSGNEKMDRGMVATVLHRMSGQIQKMPVEYRDVARDAYYANPVDWATRVGVINGVGNDMFAPTREVTRQELATMLYRYARFLGLNTSAGTEDLSGFPDTALVGDWAWDAMAWAVHVGMIQGRGAERSLAPTGGTTRAEVAVIMDRFMKQMH